VPGCAGGRERAIALPAVRARDITRALGVLYTAADLRCQANPDGTADVQIPALQARYLGVGRDSSQVAAWISVCAPYGVRVSGCDWVTAGGRRRLAVVRLARQVYGKPAGPRTSAGVPSTRPPGRSPATGPLTAWWLQSARDLYRTASPADPGLAEEARALAAARVLFPVKCLAHRGPFTAEFTVGDLDGVHGIGDGICGPCSARATARAAPPADRAAPGPEPEPELG